MMKDLSMEQKERIFLKASGEQKNALFLYTYIYIRIYIPVLYS